MLWTAGIFWISVSTATYLDMGNVGREIWGHVTGECSSMKAVCTSAAANDAWVARRGRKGTFVGSPAVCSSEGDWRQRIAPELRRIAPESRAPATPPALTPSGGARRRGRHRG